MKRNREWLAIAAVWLIIASVFVTQNIVSNRPLNATMPWMRVLWFELEYWCVFAVATPLFWWASRRFGFERGRRLESAAAHMAIAAAFAALQPLLAAALNYATIWFVGGALDPRLQRLVRSARIGYPVLVITALWKYVIILCVCRGLQYYRQFRDQEVRAARLREQLATAELRNLQMQLQPHFLFNALHSAAMLTLINPAGAHDVLVQLSDLLRTALGADAALRVTVARELDLLDRYLAIERMRFGDRFVSRFEVAEDVEDVLVPSLILQPLVENAIRHGFTATADVHHIVVRAWSDGAVLVLEVEDDGQGLAPGWSPQAVGTGLANVQARIDVANGAHTPIEITRLSPHGLRVRLRLPRETVAAESAA